MWLLILEMVLALGVIVFIVWWTLSARLDTDDEGREKREDDQ